MVISVALNERLQIITSFISKHQCRNESMEKYLGEYDGLILDEALKENDGNLRTRLKSSKEALD